MFNLFKKKTSPKTGVNSYFKENDVCSVERIALRWCYDSNWRCLIKATGAEYIIVRYDCEDADTMLAAVSAVIANGGDMNSLDLRNKIYYD